MWRLALSMTTVTESGSGMTSAAIGNAHSSASKTPVRAMPAMERRVLCIDLCVSMRACVQA